MGQPLENYVKDLFFVHVLCCFYMAGVIAMVQFIHYPCFAKIDDKHWAQFHLQHTTVMGFLVGPVMVLELATSFFLPLPPMLKFLNVFLILLIWLVTFLKAVPAHDRLRLGKRESEIAILVKSNLSRTLLWFVRAPALAILFYQQL